MDPKSVYAPSKDILFDMTSKTIPVDSSTLYRGENRITAQLGGTSTTGNGLNVEKKQTRFVIQNGTTSKLRWDTCALAVRGKFTDGVAGGAGNCVYGVPAWNALADNIESINIHINDSSTPIYECSGGNYVVDYSARLLRNYGWDILNNMDEQIFTPIAGSDADNNFAPPEWITNSKTITDTFTSVQDERFSRHRVGDADCYSTKYISFQDLFPRFPVAIMNNLRKMAIEIVWQDHSKTCMEHIENGANPTVMDPDASYLITSCEIITDFYIMAPVTQINEVNQKTAQGVDNVAYLNSQVIDYTYTGGEVMISGLKNVESVMVLQLARGKTNTDGTVAGNSCGQFMLFNNAIDAATTTFPDNCSHLDTTPSHLIKSVQMSLGEVTYPPYELKTVNDNSPDLTGLYYEYLKALNCVGSRTSKPMPLHVFQSVMPFILLKPWSSNASHLSREGKDLSLRLGKGTTSTAATQISIVIFKLNVLQISPDGATTINY